jgi:hypothetical protein
MESVCVPLDMKVIYANVDVLKELGELDVEIIVHVKVIENNAILFLGLAIVLMVLW